MIQDLSSFKERHQAARVGREGILKELALKFPDKTKGELREMLDAMLDAVQDALLSGKRVELRGMFSMWPTRMNARRSFSPFSKKVHRVDARWKVVFRAGKELKRALMEHLEA